VLSRLLNRQAAEQVSEQAAEQAADWVADGVEPPGVDAQLESEVGRSELTETGAVIQLLRLSAEAAEIAAEVVVGVVLDKVLGLVDYTAG
jgi:hypothetical protein